MRHRVSYRDALSLGVSLVSFPRARRRFSFQKRDYRLVLTKDLEDFGRGTAGLIVKSALPQNAVLHLDDDADVLIFSLHGGDHNSIINIPCRYVFGDYTHKGYMHVKKLL